MARRLRCTRQVESLQWDCGLMIRIGGQGLIATAHGPYMECSGKEVKAGDTCPESYPYF